MCNLSDLIEEKGIAQGKAEGIAQGKAEGIAQGKAEGIEEGERRLAKLMKYLSENNLADEMKLAFSDENARKVLYEKYNKTYDVYKKDIKGIIKDYKG